MITLLLVILIILWFLGYIHIDGLTIPDFNLFTINGHDITFINLLTFLVISALVGVLPSPLRQIAGVLLILWVLSVLGILAFAGLSSLLVIAIILGLIAYVFGLL